jgi:hypothetical protein
MIKSAALSVLRAVLLGTSILGVMAATAEARVGVTSATNGDPLGKPPAEPERILRIGIDVQANEVITTSANDRAHLVFLDGTSLTVGPNAQLTIDKFVFDPTTKTGELAINASKGVLRLVGGKISKTNAITVTTPSSTIGVRGGICLFQIDARRTTSIFAFGHRMTVLGLGQLVTITRPGMQVTTFFGAHPGPPTLAPPGSLVAPIAQLEGRSSGSSGGGQGGSGQGGNADQGAQKFGQQNAGPSGGQPGGPTGGLPPTNNNTINAISNANTQTQTNAVTQQPQQNPTPPPPPPPSPTQTLNGYSSGVIVGRDEGVPAVYVPQPVLNAPSDVSITTNTSTKQAQGTIVFRGVDTTTSPQLTVAGTFQFGGDSSSSQVTDANTYSMTHSTDPNRPSTLLVNGQSNTLDAVSALNSSGVVNSSTAPPASVTQNLSSMCGNCAPYLTWGWWSTSFTAPYDPDGDRDLETKIVSAPYVVGQLTTAVQMPQTGSATYSGFMTGNVWNGSSLSHVTGSFNHGWDFAARAGNFNAAFDSVNYSGATAASGSSGVNFVGGFTGGGRTGTLAGSFFGPQANVQAGGFNITNNSGSPAYQAAGVFAGSKR